MQSPGRVDEAPTAGNQKGALPQGTLGRAQLRRSTAANTRVAAAVLLCGVALALFFMSGPRRQERRAARARLRAALRYIDQQPRVDLDLTDAPITHQPSPYPSSSPNPSPDPSPSPSPSGRPSASASGSGASGRPSASGSGSREAVAPAAPPLQTRAAESRTAPPPPPPRNATLPPAAPPPAPARQQQQQQGRGGAARRHSPAWLGSPAQPLLLFVVITSNNRQMRQALRETWLSNRPRPGDYRPHEIVPRPGELRHRFFVDNLGPEETTEMSTFGDVVPMRERGKWADWLSPGWKRTYPVGLIFKNIREGGPWTGGLRCWYSEEAPHCHKDWILEKMWWTVQFVHTRHWLVTDDDSVVCTPNLLHQLRVMPLPTQAGYQPFTVGRGIFAHGLYDQCFILMTVDIVKALVDSWWDDIRGGTGEPQPADCCMFGDSFSSHRGCTAHLGGRRNLGYRCCRPCKQGTNYSLVEVLRKRGLPISKWFWARPQMQESRNLKCDQMPGKLGEKWRRGIECPGHPCTGMAPAGKKKEMKDPHPSLCGGVIEHQSIPSTWAQWGHDAEQMLIANAPLETTRCDRLPDCALKRHCRTLRESLRWCRDRLFLHKVKFPGTVQLLWRLTHGDREQQTLSPLEREWSFKNLSNSPHFGWTDSRATATKLVKLPGGREAVQDRAGRITWEWDGKC